MNLRLERDVRRTEPDLAPALLEARLRAFDAGIDRLLDLIRAMR